MTDMSLPNGSTTNSQALSWVVSDDTGSSSLTIWAVMMGVTSPTGRSSRFMTLGTPPADPDDFGRCVRLLDLVPEWKNRLAEVSSRYPRWEPLIRHWDELTTLYFQEVPTHQGSAPRLYKRMQELLHPDR